MSRNLCDIKREICRELALTAETPTSVTFTVDAFGNLDITDPSAEFVPVVDDFGNLSGSGSLIDRFYTDPYMNMKYNDN